MNAAEMIMTNIKSAVVSHGNINTDIVRLVMSWDLEIYWIIKKPAYAGFLMQKMTVSPNEKTINRLYGSSTNCRF